MLWAVDMHESMFTKNRKTEIIIIMNFFPR